MIKEEISDKAPPKIILGMSVKRETTFANTLSIPMIFVVTTAAGAYYNTQQVTLLTNPDYFNVRRTEVGRTEGNILFYATLVAVIVSIGVGYTFDLFGRRKMIAGSYILLVFLIWTLPYTPTIFLLIVNRAGVQVAF